MQRYTGTYDASGEPGWTDGDLLLESIGRFNGRRAPAIVLTECDFAEWGSLQKRLLSVGFTRAKMQSEWVMSECTATLVAGLLGQEATWLSQ